MRGDPFPAPGVAHALGRGRLDVDEAGLDPEIRGEALTHGLDVRTEPRALGDGGQVDVRGREPTLRDLISNALETFATQGAF